MEDEIVLAGKKYVSSKRAAEISGYAKDYVGQLCRGGKLNAKLIGRNWYILLESLEKVSKKDEQSPKDVQQFVKAKVQTHPRTTLLDDLNPSFYSDDTPLMPPVVKPEETSNVVITQIKKESKIAVGESETSATVPKKGISVQHRESKDEDLYADHAPMHAQIRFAPGVLVVLLLVSFAIAGLVYPFTGSTVSFGKDTGVSSAFFMDTQLANAFYSQYAKMTK